MECECAKYIDLELSRAPISKRIKETKVIKKHLEQLAKHVDGESVLLKCKTCGQFWQINRAWNWGNDEYAFKVPEIEIKKWMKERYSAPDEMMIYSAVMSRFMETNNFNDSAQECREENCIKMAVEGLPFCLSHHVEQLSNIGKLPKKPVGKLFPPYYVNRKE
jgi:hypothetical protein